MNHRRRFFSRMRRLAALAAAALTCGALGAPGSAVAGEPALNIAPGLDFFETEPNFTFVDFPPSVPPANFFGPGSDPFQGHVQFGGQPLETFGPQQIRIGDADTIVRRLDPIEFPQGQNFPRSDPMVRIEIVALSLVSIEPIMVTYNGGQNPEPWNVQVDLAQNQQPGNANVTEEAAQQGTFDTQLPVIPRFRFVRLSDRAVRTLQVPPFPFQGQNAPWRLNCALPVLPLPQLTGPFCPGQLPGDFPGDGHKALMSFQAPGLAEHAAWPVQPMLEHFKCYSLRSKAFGPVNVQLADQFGDRAAQIERRPELCNPVQKNREQLRNKRAHLVCYGAPGPTVDIPVAVQNQLGSQRLLVKSPRRLCAPSQKRLPGEDFRNVTVPIDHFQCYGVEPQTRIRTAKKIKKVDLKDQFHTEKDVRIGKPYQLCAPVKKTHPAQTFPIRSHVRHLVCYELDEGQFPRKVQTRNQFEKKKVKTHKPIGLCVPSNKFNRD